MASKAMWEVDPETRSKLLAIQKESDNSLCCDCNAPSPQWASPKFGIFICLSCAGVHRGLGVHISFVRSISMDAFKQSEIERMRLGGNSNWRKFFDEHEDTKMRGLSWDDATIAERYNGVVGEEWKERLSAKVEGKEYVPGERTSTPAPPTNAAANSSAAAASRSSTPLSGTAGGGSPQRSGGKVKVDDKYFTSLGKANAARPDNLPPSQGGKYSGFGNSPMPAKDDGPPKFDDLQKDPLAAISKGFGWFSSTVTKTASSVNKDFIQPTTKQFGESDFAAQAKSFGGRIAQSAQAGAKSASEGFNKFVEGPDNAHGSGRQATSPLDESKKDFWDNFASLADQRKTTGSSIGTAAMGKGASGGAAGPAAGAKKGQDEWDDW